LGVGGGVFFFFSGRVVYCIATIGAMFTTLYSNRLPSSKNSKVVSALIPRLKAKELYTATRNKVCSKRFWYRVLFIFVWGYTIRSAILYFGGVNVILDLLHPASVAYWITMAITPVLSGEWVDIILPDKLFMDSNSGPSGSSASAGDLSGSNKAGANPQGSSRENTRTSTEVTKSSSTLDILARIDALNASLQKQLSEIGSINREYNLDHLKKAEVEFKQLCDKEVFRVHEYLLDYTKYLNAYDQYNLNKAFTDTAKDQSIINDKIKILYQANDKEGGIKRILLEKETFDLNSNYQEKQGKIIKDAVFKSLKEKRIEQEQAKRFLTGWIEIVQNRQVYKDKANDSLNSMKSIAKSLELSRKGSGTKK